MNRTQLAQLAVFAAVARAGSFRQAAADLAIAPSAVSHAVQALEASLGVRLMARTTRAVAPTEEGRLLLATLSPALADIAGVLEDLRERRQKPSGPLRVTMPMMAAEDVIAPRLPAFLDAYPDIEFDLRIDDRFEDIVEAGLDAGLRLGENLHADMIAVRASGPWRSLIVGAPAYFERHPKPAHPRALTGHDCIRRRFTSGRLYRWELEKDGRALSVDVTGRLILADQGLMHRAALDGVGLAFLFEHRVADDIAAGRLVPVLEDWCPAFDGFHIYYPSRRQMRPALRAFVDFFRYSEAVTV